MPIASKTRRGASASTISRATPWKNASQRSFRQYGSGPRPLA
jgi:hypothetical protein